MLFYEHHVYRYQNKHMPPKYGILLIVFSYIDSIDLVDKSVLKFIDTFLDTTFILA